MAVYKVPQDVEADDKLLGPFNFRQFIYLLIVAALIALAWALAQIFPLLAIFPLPPALFLLILALPLRKDQPMETYIAALIQFYTKPNKRFWNPGQRESTITITAPKKVEKPLTRDITEEEAGRRLSFLATVVDSEGMSIKGDLATPANSSVRSDIVAEANAATDIFENYQSTQISANLTSEADLRRAEIVNSMRAAIKANKADTSAEDYGPFASAYRSTTSSSSPSSPTPSAAPASNTSTPTFNPDVLNPATVAAPAVPPPPPSPSLVALSNADDLSVASIANQASRQTSRKAKDKEVYISLH